MGHQLLNGYGRIFNGGNDSVHHFTQIVRGDIGSHTDGNARRAVDQQIRYLGRENQRLLQRVVIVGPHLHGLFIKIHQHLVSQLRHPDFGVTHRCRRVTVNRAEVTLTVHHRVTQGKLLRHPDNGIVGSRIAMGMVLTDNITDDTGRFLVRFIVIITHVIHGIQAAPVNRLETVAYVRQSPADDDRHGIIHVGFFHFIFNIYGYLVCLV